MLLKENPSVSPISNVDYSSLAILSSIPNPVVIMKPDTSIEYVNPATEVITGFSKSELVGHKAPYPYWPETKIGAFSKELEKGMPHSGCREYIFQKKNGQPFWIKMTFAPITINGKSACILANWIDITSRVINEEKLRRSEERFRLLAENARDLIFRLRLKPKLEFDFISPSVTAITGYTPDDYYRDPKLALRMIHPDDRSISRELGRKFIRFRCIRKNGSLVLFELVNIPIRDRAGEVIALEGIARDISEQQKLKEHLQESEAFNFSLMENSPHPTIVADKDTSIRYVNPALESLTGFTHAELIGLKVPYPWWPPEMHQQYSKVDCNGKSKEIDLEERKYIKKSGEPFWAAVSIRNIKNNESVQCYLGTWIDITEEKKVADELKLNQFRLESLLRISQFSPFQIQDLLDLVRKEAMNLTDSRIGFVSLYNEQTQEFEKNTWPRGMIRGCRIRDFRLKPILQNAGIWGAAIQQRKPVVLNDLQTLDPVQDPFPRIGFKYCRYLAVPIFAEDKIVAVIALADKASDYNQSDVLQLSLLMDMAWKIIIRLKTENTLKENEEKYRSLVNNINLGIFRSTPGINGKYLEVNTAMETLLGYSRDELLDMKISDLYALSEDRPTLSQLNLSSSTPMRHETRLRRKDGKEIITLSTVSIVLDKNGRVQYLDGILEDITGRRQREAEILEIETLKRLNQAKNELLANVSHELRTPISSIKGFIETLIEPDVRWTRKQKLDFLQSANAEADRLTKLVKNLLEISRIESGKFSLEESSCTLQQILESCQPILNALVSKHKLKINIPSDLPDLVVDKVRIAQILTNLVENATKFSPEGSLISIQAHHREPDLIISVSDQGVGMTPETIKNLFNRFYQAEQVVSGKARGTGLGLAICKGIVEAHHGKIWVESRLGQGSTFFFSLPRKNHINFISTVNFR